MVVNGGKMRTKGEQRRRKGFIGFSRNLLISFDYGQLRQVLMKLVVRLLAEGLQVRVLPGVLPMKTRSREPAVPPVRLVFSLLPSFAAARLYLLYAAGSTDAGMDKPKKKP